MFRLLLASVTACCLCGCVPLKFQELQDNKFVEPGRTSFYKEYLSNGFDVAEVECVEFNIVLKTQNTDAELANKELEEEDWMYILDLCMLAEVDD